LSKRVLVGEPRALPHLEVALFAPEAPDDLARLAVDLVDGRGPAGGDEQVAVAIHVHGVYVEVVEAVGRFVGRLVVGLAYIDVLQAAPLEEHLARLDVYLLDYAVQDEAHFRTTVRGEVPGGLGVDCDEGGVTCGDEELVMVAGVAVARRESLHLPVGVVENDVLPIPVAAVDTPPPGEDGLPPVGLRPEAHDVRLAWRGGSKPH
jgi:hypothetical protein